MADTYVFERELEGGGMSRVFVAEDRNVGRKVVVKVLTNAVAGKLTRAQGMRVIAPNGATVYAAGNPRDAAKNSLRATFVLERTVEREGNHVRVTASLTSTEDGVMQWADVFDRSSSDLFQVEDQIAAAIVQAVSPSQAPAKFPTGRQATKPL